ncbi:MAG: hypothetical protein LBK61_12425 [Spirochaetaceae bacterium]|nr:hypothetical protein [Spirochaetaceae bacterium]
MMKKGIALIVLMVVAGQSLFCADFRLGGRQPAAVFNGERESIRLDRSLAQLDRSLARFAPDSVRPEPLAMGEDWSNEEWGIWGIIVGGFLMLGGLASFVGSSDTGLGLGGILGGLVVGGLGVIALTT